MSEDKSWEASSRKVTNIEIPDQQEGKGTIPRMKLSVQLIAKTTIILSNVSNQIHVNL